MEIQEIDTNLIDVSDFNARKHLAAGTEDSSVEDLANSIREAGLLSPIIVRSRSDGRFDLIAGQRRLLAARKIGMQRIPAVLRNEIEDADITTISLIENVHRAELDPMDKARAIRQIFDNDSGDYQRVCTETGLSQPTIRKYLQLLTLPEDIQVRISSAEGPAKLEALAELSRTFRGPEQMRIVYDQIAGFAQDVQKEILRRSDGDIGRIPALVSEAIEGSFAVHMCRTPDDCYFIRKLPIQLREYAKGLLKSATESAKKSGEVPRERALYWIQKSKPEKSVLIFDPGYEGGDVHIYEHRESIRAADIKEEILRTYGTNKLPESLERDVVGMWARSRGANLAWRVSEAV